MVQIPTEGRGRLADGEVSNRLRSDPLEAEQIMRRAGLEPLVPFPGAHQPWPSIHFKCGQQTAPLLSNVRRRGTGCRQCGAWKRGAARRAAHAAAGVSTMVSAGFEPLEGYPGAAKPWRCRHLSCGREVTPTLNAVRRNGAACRPCSVSTHGWRTWSEVDAVSFFRRHGLEPLEPYPGSSSKPWRARHVACGRVVNPRLGNIAQGQGPCRECGQEATHRALRLEDHLARELMLASGLEPLEPFQGVDAPWRCRHLPCGREVRPTYTNVKRGQGGCSSCAAEAAATRLRLPEGEAVAVFLAAGLEPVEPYPGSARPWRAVHDCGRQVSPTLSNVRAGRGICRYCNSAFPWAGAAHLYLASDGEAHKIGIAAPDGQRLATHRRFGWLHVWSIAMPTGDDAYNLEQAVISHWRNDLGYPAAYPGAAMPQTGASETVSAALLTCDDILEYVLRRMEEQGLDDPVLLVP